MLAEALVLNLIQCAEGVIQSAKRRRYRETRTLALPFVRSAASTSVYGLSNVGIIAYPPSRDSVDSTSFAPSMPTFIFCCTCAAARGRGSDSDAIDDKTEKPLKDVPLSCCGRTICARCVAVRSCVIPPRGLADLSQVNPRFATYCPFCQKLRLDHESSRREPTVPQPPPYAVDDPAADVQPRTPPPPPQPAPTEPIQPPPEYSAVVPPQPVTVSAHTVDGGLSGNSRSSTAQIANPPPAAGQQPADEDVQHFLAPADSLASLALAYGVPPPVLRSHNRLHSDHLLSARRTVRIPRSHYKGGSLSPHPVEGEEESERKARLRRFMVSCKCADYKVAGLYLEEQDWDLERAMQKWWEDERWEKDNPMPKGKIAQRR